MAIINNKNYIQNTQVDVLNKRDFHLQSYTRFLVKAAEDSTNLRCFRKKLRQTDVRFHSHSGDIKCSKHKYLVTLLYNCDKTMYDDKENILQILEIAHTEAISNIKNNIDSLGNKYYDLEQKRIILISKLEYAEQSCQESLYTQTYCEIERIEDRMKVLNKNYNYGRAVIDDSIHAKISDIHFRADKPYSIIDINYTL